jgi:hypothetical protein
MAGLQAQVSVLQTAGALNQGLKTGKPQNEARHGGDLFDTLYSDSEGILREQPGHI